MFDDDADEDPEGSDAFEGEAASDDERPAVFVTTTTAIPITVQRMEDERAPEGVCLGAFIGERLVARCAMPSEAIEHLLRLDLFAEPVHSACSRTRRSPASSVACLRSCRTKS